MATPPAFDWAKCLFCQRTIRNWKINCPADSRRADAGCGYRSLSETVSRYMQLGELPRDISSFVHVWDEGDGMETTLSRHRACWHVKCRQRLVHGTKLERLQKDDGDKTVRPSSPVSSDSDVTMLTMKAPRLARASLDKEDSSVCFFCELPGTELRQVMTFAVDDKVRHCANIINDSMLIAKLASGDMIATEARYHPSCLLQLYYKASQMHSKDTGIDCEGEPAPNIDGESLALAEVIAYLEDRRFVGVTPSVFKLSELTKLYTDLLAKYGVSSSGKIHSSRLKDRLLSNCPDLTCVSHGRDVLLTFKDHVGVALQHAREHADSDAVHLMHVAKMLRSVIFSSNCEFAGSLASPEMVTAPSLLSFMTMLLEGPCVDDNVVSQAALSLSQLVMFNAVKRRRKSNNAIPCSKTMMRHAADREPPLPLYVGLMLHSSTREKKVIKKFHKLGLSVSYDRVLQVLNKTANAVCKQYRAENIVCPPNLQPNLFSVAAVDNIDHNLTSSTAQSSFHGTAVSVMQFADSYSSTSHSQLFCPYDDNISDSVSDIILPASYSDICPFTLSSRDPVLPPAQAVLTDSCFVSSDEYAWLDSVRTCLNSEMLQDNCSWSAFHADKDDRATSVPVISALLPLFRHAANTPAMMRHSLIVIRDIVLKLNPSQTPVVTVDQPLYALLKQIQWHCPVQFGEDKFVVLLGGLHIEMAVLRMLGHWLTGSGWIQCLVEAGIATSGVAQSFLSASHVKRTRYVHTVTAAALYINLLQMYAEYCNNQPDGPVDSFGKWRADRELSSVQFKYWSMVLELELLMLSFVRSLRMGNFHLYVDCMQQLASWFFVFDHTNYARWLPVHIRDMLALKYTHPDVYEHFLAGNFTINKSGRKFSNIAVDHAHEQLNALIKGEGGVIGLTEKDAALCRWAVAAPEVVRMLEEFEFKSCANKHVDNSHHEQSSSVQSKFKQDVSKLLVVFDVEVPFSATTGDDLIVLCSNMLADRIVADTVKRAKEMGSSQFHTYFQERLMDSEMPMSVLSPIPRNKLPLFSYKKFSKSSTVTGIKLTELKTDCELFSRLYIACQVRDGNLDEFFHHENQVYPPALSQGGALRSGSKSELLDCLVPFYAEHEMSDMSVECCVLDGAAIVQMVRPNCSSTFGDYKNKVFLPYICSLLKTARRVDVIFDVYRHDSLKMQTRQKRGTGVRTRVTAKTKIPSNWHEFLRVDENKTELFHFLADTLDPELTELSGSDKSVVMTVDDSVTVSGSPVSRLTDIQPCNHEEADTRILLHCLHAARCGNRRLCIRTVDTDVVVLAVSAFSLLEVCELWIHFGVGKHVKLLPIHELCAGLEPKMCAVLPVFHAVTGCDTVSFLYGKGKKSAWSAWRSFPQLTEALLNLRYVTGDIDASLLSVLEQFIVLLYDRTSDCTSLDLARKQLFTKKGRSLENLPPTSDAFNLHMKRVIYQSVYCWSHCLEKCMPLHDPVKWGWCQTDNTWMPVWMTLPQVAVTCQELVHCSCKKACTSRCTCVKASLPCTSLCQCDGECSKS